MTAPPAQRDKSRNPEQYAPALLLHLLGIALAPTESVKLWTAWLQTDLARRNWLALGELTGQGSWNHLFMLGACALHLGLDGAVDFWMLLLGYQIGAVRPLSPEAELLACLDGSEPYAAEYAGYRLGSVAAVRLWAAKNSHDALRIRCQAYFDLETAALSLFAIGRPDPAARMGQHGMQYSGPEVLPVGERTNNRIVSPLGPLLGLLTNWEGLVIRAGAADWAVQVAQQARGLFAASAPLARAARLWIDTPTEATLKPLAAALEGAHLRPGAEQHLWAYRDGRAAWKPRRTNGNTPCNYAALAPIAGPCQTLYPWDPGRAAKAKGEGHCEPVKVDGGWALTASAEITDLAPLELPPGEPLLMVSFGGDGLEAAS